MQIIFLCDKISLQEAVDRKCDKNTKVRILNRKTYKKKGDGYEIEFKIIFSIFHIVVGDNGRLPFNRM